MKTALCVVLVAVPVLADPPTRIMYFQPQAEMRLSIKLKRMEFPWYTMRVGIAESGEHELGMVRFRIKSGVTRGEICRQAKQAALIAFHTLPKLVRLDVDAAEADDTSTAKAVPWFAASIPRQSALQTDPLLPPEEWLSHQGVITYSERLAKDPKPSELAGATAYQFFNECLNRVPVTRHAKPGKKPAVARPAARKPSVDSSR